MAPEVRWEVGSLPIGTTLQLFFCLDACYLFSCRDREHHSICVWLQRPQFRIEQLLQLDPMFVISLRRECTRDLQL